MDSAHRRLGDPDYVRTTLSGLEQFFVETDVIDAADFLDRMFPETFETRERSDAVAAVQAEPVATAVDAESATFSESQPTAEPVPAVATPENVATAPDTTAAAPEAPAPPPAAAAPFVAPALAPAMDVLLTRLSEAESLLQSANFRIGYLQSEIDRYRDQVRLLPDLEAQAKRASELERHNQDFRQRLPELEQRARHFVAVQKENELLRQQLQEAYTRRSTPWWHFWNGLVPTSRRGEQKVRAHDDQYVPRAGRRGRA